MDQVIGEAMAALSQQTSLGGWAAVVGSLGVAVMFGIRIFKLAAPDKFQGLDPWLQRGIVFGCAAIGTFAVALAAKIVAGAVISAVIGQLIVAALGAGVTAMLAHKITKPIGAKMDAMLAERYPDSEPGLVRKAGSLLVDIPKPQPPSG